MNASVNTQSLQQLASGTCRTLALTAMLAVCPLFVQAAPADKAVASTSVSQVQAGKVNINDASAEELSTLNGIGEAKAQSIVSYRTKFGRFTSVEDLLAVDGIGQATLIKNRNRLGL